MSVGVGFDPLYWGGVIQDPDWYLEFVPYMHEALKKMKDDPQEASKFIKSVRYFFEQALEGNNLALASEGPNLDKERKPIDTIVIHHTSANPGYKLSYMNAVQLLNIYAPYYANPTIREERKIKGTHIWSGHFLNGKPSFIGYHWLMRMDGTFERLLKDEELGWHAGNWEINKRSVGICLDNDYDQKDPNSEILQKLADHIKEHYGFVRKSQIIGHCEAREGTSCPGSGFKQEWKSKLLDIVSNA
jgi:hypothetical protein